VTGVASLCAGSSADGDALRQFTRTKLAAFKVPKQLIVVDQVRRAPNGKADYQWARETVEEQK
jgi:fatty-acyl-CoA synthase